MTDGMHPWRAIIHDPVSGESVELVTDPEEIPAVPSGTEFTITWDHPPGTARFTLGEAPGEAGHGDGP